MNSDAAIRAVQKVMDNDSWKAFKETFKEITLVIPDLLEKLARDAQNKFRGQMDLLGIDVRIRFLLKESPSGVFLFCKSEAVKECRRIFNMLFPIAEVEAPRVPRVAEEPRRPPVAEEPRRPAPVVEPPRPEPYQPIKIKSIPAKIS